MFRVANADLEYAMETGPVWARAPLPVARQPRPGPGYQGGLAPHVLVETDRGPVPAGALAAGDLVRTRDHGFRPLLWVGLEQRRGSDPAAVRVTADAFGRSARHGQALLAADQHLLLRHAMNEVLFAGREVLCKASDLTHLPGIGPAQGRPDAPWLHLLFDRLEVIRVQGLWLASFAPDMAGLRRRDAAAAQAVEQAVPSLRYEAGLAAYADEWLRLNRRETRLLDRDGFQA